MRGGSFLVLFSLSALYLTAMAGSQPVDPGQFGLLSILAAAFLGLAVLAVVAARRRERRLAGISLGVFAASLSSTVPLDCWGHPGVSIAVCWGGTAGALTLALAGWYRGYRALSRCRQQAVRSAPGRRR